jgi:hypothetical protein
LRRVKHDITQIGITRRCNAPLAHDAGLIRRKALAKDIMRSDMHKVIVERPRFLRRPWQNKKTALRLSTPKVLQAVDEGEDYDSGPSRASSARHEKWLNENLAPLCRYLESQVGRPWDKVYGEIRKGIDTRSAIGLHVLQHVGDFVAVHTMLRDGVVYKRSWNCWAEVDGMYVHPVTGILRRTPRRARQRFIRAREDVNCVRITGTVYYEKINGLWFYVEVEPRITAGRQTFVIIEKRQCGGKLIRRIEAGEFGPFVSVRAITNGLVCR